MFGLDVEDERRRDDQHARLPALRPAREVDRDGAEQQRDLGEACIREERQQPLQQKGIRRAV